MILHLLELIMVLMEKRCAHDSAYDHVCNWMASLYIVSCSVQLSHARLGLLPGTRFFCHDILKPASFEDMLQSDEHFRNYCRYALALGGAVLSRET